MDLGEIADRLYAGLPADFTPDRTAAEKEARAAGDKELAASIKALRKPSTAAWAVNLLVRWEGGQIDQVLELAASLREAAGALDGTELRALTKQRRQLTAALTTRARQLALEHGVRLTGAVAEQVEATLTAALLDERAGRALRTGLLVAPMSATGVDEIDLDAVLALPDALGHQAPAAAPAGGLRAVPDNRALRREAAREALAAAEEEQARAEAVERTATRRVRDAEGRRLGLQAEMDELQRRWAELESSVEALDIELERLSEEADEAGEARAEADRAAEQARAALDDVR